MKALTYLLLACSTLTLGIAGEGSKSTLPASSGALTPISPSLTTSSHVTPPAANKQIEQVDVLLKKVEAEFQKLSPETQPKDNHIFITHQIQDFKEAAHKIIDSKIQGQLIKKAKFLTAQWLGYLKNLAHAAMDIKPYETKIASIRTDHLVGDAKTLADTLLNSTNAILKKIKSTENDKPLHTLLQKELVHNTKELERITKQHQKK